MITILHRGEGSLGTPKNDYVICARPLKDLASDEIISWYFTFPDKFWGFGIDRGCVWRPFLDVNVIPANLSSGRSPRSKVIPTPSQQTWMRNIHTQRQYIKAKMGEFLRDVSALKLSSRFEDPFESAIPS